MEKVEAFINYMEILADKARSNGDHNGLTAIKAAQESLRHAKVEEYANWFHHHSSAPYVQGRAEARKAGTL